MKTWQNFAGNSGTATTAWNYDPYHGRMTSKIYQDGNGPSYTYTKSGKLDARTWARGVITDYAYNTAGELWTTIYSDSTPAITNSYDRLGRLHTVEHNNILTTLTNNNAGQLLAETYTGGILDGLSVTSGFNYAQQTLVSVPGYITNSYTYDAASRLSIVSDGAHSAEYTYLANSPLVSQIAFKENSTVRMTTTKRVDFMNRLQSINSAPSSSGQFPVFFGYSYNKANQRTRASREDGSYWEYNYDKLGQVVSGKKFWNDGTPVAGQQFEYGYDDIGNRTVSNRGGDEMGYLDTFRALSYTNNLLNQISSKGVDNVLDITGVTTPAATLTVFSDPIDYRRGEYFWTPYEVHVNETADLEINATIGSNSIMERRSAFTPAKPEYLTYDLDGNLTGDGRWSYTWDGENRLIQMEKSSGQEDAMVLNFQYDYQSRRINKTVVELGNTNVFLKFIYDGSNLLTELNATNSNVVRSYVWGLDLSGGMQGAGGVGGLVAVRESMGVPYFVAYDGLGNVIALVQGSSGTVSAVHEYAPFGESIKSSGSYTANPLRFSSKYYDQESGHLYYYMRYYHPSLGRWLQRDQLDEAEGINLFHFVFNNPTSFIDSDGQQAVPLPGPVPVPRPFPIPAPFPTPIDLGPITPPRIDWKSDSMAVEKIREGTEDEARGACLTLANATMKKNKYIYSRASFGRSTGAAAILYKAKSGDRPLYVPPGYDAANRRIPRSAHKGHLIPSQYGGKDGEENITTQETHFNLSLFKKATNGNLNARLSNKCNVVCIVITPSYIWNKPVAKDFTYTIVDRWSFFKRETLTQPNLFGDLRAEKPPWRGTERNSWLNGNLVQAGF